MKIRTDFVTNSSSSSFIFSKIKNDKLYALFEESGLSILCGYDDEFDDLVTYGNGYEEDKAPDGPNAGSIAYWFAELIENNTPTEMGTRPFNELSDDERHRIVSYLRENSEAIDSETIYAEFEKAYCRTDEDGSEYKYEERSNGEIRYNSYYDYFGDNRLWEYIRYGDVEEELRTNAKDTAKVKADPFVKSIDGVIYNQDFTELLAFPRVNGPVEFNVPNGVKKIAKNAFAECETVRKVVFPKSLVEIDEFAFECCESLEKIVFSEGIKKIGTGAFGLLSHLTEVHFPDNDIEIMFGAFLGCGIKELVLPKYIKSIGQSAFAKCRDITTLVIPEGVVSIGSSAFQFNSNLVSVQFPKSLKKIGSYAFLGCKNLNELNINLRDNDIEISWGAFAHCASLVDKNGFLIVNGELVYYSGYEQEVTIPSDVKLIQKCINFMHHPEIKVLNIPKDCIIETYADSNPFKGMTGLADDNDIVSVNGTMYDYVGHSTCLTIPEYINKIEKYALENEFLQEVVINKNVKFVSCRCFGTPNKNPRIILDNYVPQTDGDRNAFVSEFNEISDNGLYVVDNVLIYAETDDEEMIVPDGIKRICPYAFDSCCAITIVLPKSIERIDECALAAGKEYIFEGDVESIDKGFITGNLRIKSKKGTNIERLSLEDPERIVFIPVE